MKKHRKLKVFIGIVSCIVVFLITVNIIPPSKVMEDNPFISKDETPMLCAHRGGGMSNPENTLKAYKAAVNEYEVEILETDLWMSSDGYLVLGHDGTINRTSDVEQVTNSSEPYHISDHTYAELLNFNYGALFVDKQNNQPYKDLVSIDQIDRIEVIKQNDLQLLLIEELFETFYSSHPELLYIVEIKNSGEKGFEAASILNNLLTVKFPSLQNRVVIGTFHNDIESYIKKTYPNLLTGASVKVASKFIITQLLKVNIFDNDKFACLQIPTSQDVGAFKFDLTWKTYLKRCHQRNIAIQYWTINDEETMRFLINRQVDAIMTDDPELLLSVLNTYK